MKKIVWMLIIALPFVSGCKKDKEEDQRVNKLPARFCIDIPVSISWAGTTKDMAYDTLYGNEIYEHMRVFINVGEESANIVATIIGAIGTYNIDREMEFDYTGQDGRSKHAIVEQNKSLEGTSYEFKMDIKDNDGSNAMLIYWNTSPIKGVAFLRPYNLDRTTIVGHHNAVVRVDYDETGTSYEKTMIVQITGLDSLEVNWMDKMKMFVGKTGNQIDVYGNSNHPSAIIVDPNYTGGRNWAFVARADDAEDIGVAIVDLPPCAANTVTLANNDYSIYHVLETEINNIGITDSTAIANYLANAQEPGYFIGTQGFVSCGSVIPNHIGFTSVFLDLSGLAYYIPNDIRNLVINY